MDTDRFKECPCCGQWLSADEVINDPDCRLEGMYLDEDDTSFNLYLFTHLKKNCNSSFAILATEFDQFMDEKSEHSVLAGTPACEMHCPNIDDISECSQKCFWAPYRRFMIKMLELKQQKHEPFAARF